jgi:CheY-like chemotaxis protein
MAAALSFRRWLLQEVTVRRVVMADGKKILIVDDEIDLAKLWELRLKNSGYDVRITGDGTEALTSIKDSRPDMIIADVVMPEMDGFTLYKELKKDQSTRDIPVIIVTGRSKMADSFAALGVNDFLVKPFDAKALLDKIEEVFLKSAVQPVSTAPVLIAVEDTPSSQLNWAAILMSGLFLLVFGGALFLIFYLVSAAGTKDVANISEYSQAEK